VDNPACKLRACYDGRVTLTITEFASKGGHARAKKLSARRRREIARAAGKKGGRQRAKSPNNVEPRPAAALTHRAH
jgi:hypothetical protein